MITIITIVLLVVLLLITCATIFSKSYRNDLLSKNGTYKVLGVNIAGPIVFVIWAVSLFSVLYLGNRLFDVEYGIDLSKLELEFEPKENWYPVNYETGRIQKVETIVNDSSFRVFPKISVDSEISVKKEIEDIYNSIKENHTYFLVQEKSTEKNHLDSIITYICLPEKDGKFQKIGKCVNPEICSKGFDTITTNSHGIRFIRFKPDSHIKNTEKFDDYHFPFHISVTRTKFIIYYKYTNRNRDTCVKLNRIKQDIPYILSDFSGFSKSYYLVICESTIADSSASGTEPFSNWLIARINPILILK